MAAHEKSHYKSLEEVQAQIEALGANITLQTDLSPLHRQVKVGALTAPNAIAVLPMEGCDSERDGSASWSSGAICVLPAVGQGYFGGRPAL